MVATRGAGSDAPTCAHLLACVGLWLGSTACFDEPASASEGPSSSTGEASAGESTSSGTSESGHGPTGDSTAVHEVDTGDASTTGAAATEGASSSSTGGCLVQSDPDILWAEEAEVVAPMELEVAPLLPDMPMLARSYAGSAGTITFAFDLSCPAAIEIHALVRDPIAGAGASDDPDSYFVTVDDGDEEVWTYGCGTEGVGDQTWLWQRVSISTEAACDTTPLSLELAAGAHEVTLRNRESGGGTEYAAIVALIVSDDPRFDPATVYDPSP